MVKSSQDIQRIGFAKKHSCEKTLAELFANNGLLSRVGGAFVWVSRRGKDGTLYGSARYVHQKCLEGREYILSRSGVFPWIIHITFTDEIYEIRKPTRSLTVLQGKIDA